MLPIDTITKHLSLTGNSTSTLIQYPCTILGIQVMQERVASNIQIYDSAENILINYALNTPYIEQNHVCIGNVLISKTGNDSAFITINYLPYDVRTSTSGLASTTQQFFNGFTKGEVLTNYLLLILMAGAVFGFFTKYINNKLR